MRPNVLTRSFMFFPGKAFALTMTNILEEFGSAQKWILQRTKGHEPVRILHPITRVMLDGIPKVAVSCSVDRETSIIIIVIHTIIFFAQRWASL